MNTEILNWDSDFFGLKTARICTPDLDEQHLAKTLQNLRSRNVRLVYWPASHPANFDVSALGGRLVDQKATFELELAKSPTLTAPPQVEVKPFTRDIPQQVLWDLALQAGSLSRFARDPQFPPDRFQALYLEWMRKSLNGEMADEVLVAAAQDVPTGMVTLSAREDSGEIGLIAVEEGFRGRHVGLALMAAAHDWYAARHLHRARVVTQADNQPACRLYRRCGYEIARTEYFYHFWL
ncbi:MAG: dTDP-4-amino-4,6-dideoxy-D-galactose acyltransferase [Chloroflexota bacterium]|nr:dTDP-4-amino-4,6-dideoxy-D-galactose acyltransferase [Chloroflexota bacterium]